jgi:uncharacterized protein YegP (UPF0339 family)
LEFVRQATTYEAEFVHGTVLVDGPPEWYWRFLASNGRETGRSSETYKNRVDCIRSAELTTGCYAVRENERRPGNPYCWRRDPRNALEQVNVRWVK